MDVRCSLKQVALSRSCSIPTIEFTASSFMENSLSRNLSGNFQNIFRIAISQSCERPVLLKHFKNLTLQENISCQVSYRQWDAISIESSNFQGLLCYIVILHSCYVMFYHIAKCYIWAFLSVFFFFLILLKTRNYLRNF